MQTGDNVLIGGFIIRGSGNKRLIVRGLGRSTGLPGALPDPFLSLFDSSGHLLAENDDWPNSPNAAEIVATGIPPQDSKESAILMSVPASNYTAVLRGANNLTGVGLLEVYDLDTDAPARVVNISSRGFVLSGDDVMIGGVIVTGNDSSRYVVRALGPTLGNFGVPTVLADPLLEIHDSNGDLIARNDNWTDTQQAELSETGLQPPSERESAILISLFPGNYTAVVKGADGGVGNGLVEFYNLAQ